MFECGRVEQATKGAGHGWIGRKQPVAGYEVIDRCGMKAKDRGGCIAIGGYDDIHFLSLPLQLNDVFDFRSQHIIPYSLGCPPII